MVQLLNGPWRHELAAVASSARESVVVAAPFIKDEEAAWFCDQLHHDTEVTTLANINTEAVSASALDLSALRRLADASASARLVALPSLHAKVFVADETMAIVTSGNLTHSALDRNMEYGVLLQEPELVRAVRRDMIAFERLGSEVDSATLIELFPLETELRKARAGVASSAPFSARRRFNEALRKARPEFIAMQVGDRSANAVFGEAIQLALAQGPRTTKAIGEEVRRLLPDLCDDRENLVIKGARYGKRWKHRLRNAQQHLKQRGSVVYRTSDRTWALAEGTET